MAVSGLPLQTGKPSEPERPASQIFRTPGPRPEVDRVLCRAQTAWERRLPVRQGAPAEGFYVVHQGAINVHRINASGKAQVIHVFRVGESFAEAALFENTGYPANASALEQTSVLLVPKTAFLELLRKRPELALRMLASMSRHLQTLVGLIDDLTLKDVQTRLVGWLLKRCGKSLGNEPLS